MVDNFKQISELLTFDSEDEFYFVQIIQRKKDNKGVKGSNNKNRLMKAYYIRSVEQLMDLKPEMIHLATYFNARVGINLNKRSFEKTAFNTLLKIANQMHNRDFMSVRRAYNTACGIHNAVDDKVWILDIDSLKGSDKIRAIRAVQYSEPVGTDKLLADIPTNNGYHLITKPFNTLQFSEVCPDIEIHKNNPCALYYP